jgi:hypothetical protein
MNRDAGRLFLEISTRRLALFRSRIETCLEMLDEEKIWARGGENENAVGNLVLHLCGNVRQWIVSGVGGRPDVRERDAEFAAHGGDPALLAARLRQTVDEAVAVIEQVDPARFTERLLVQRYEVSVLEAIYSVVDHFSMHTGQIIFATKMLTGADLGFYAHLRAGAAQKAE